MTKVTPLHTKITYDNIVMGKYIFYGCKSFTARKAMADTQKIKKHIITIEYYCYYYKSNNI